MKASQKMDDFARFSDLPVWYFSDASGPIAQENTQ